jgi:hypothetical protein
MRRECTGRDEELVWLPFDSLRSLRAFSKRWPAMSELGGVPEADAR